MREGDGQADNIMAEDEARRWRRSGRMIDSYGENNEMNRCYDFDQPDLAFSFSLVCSDLWPASNVHFHF